MHAAVSNACSQGPQEEAGLWLLRSVLLILSVATKTTATQQLAASRAFQEAFTAHQAGRLGDTAPVHLTSFLLTVREYSLHSA